MSNYPGSIDDNTSLPLTTDLVTAVKAEIVNNLRSAILAIETELGPNPSSIYSNVRARLDAMQSVLTGLTSAIGVPIGPVSGDLSGSLPSPNVIDLTISGQVQGSLLYFNGSNWVQLSPGTDGFNLTTHGSGANPSWAASTALSNTVPVDVSKSAANAGTSTSASRQDHHHSISTAAPINIGNANTEGSATTLARSDHQHNLAGTVGGDLSGTLPNPTVSGLHIASQAQGDILYFNGSNWVVLAPGTDGYFLTTHSAGNNPTWTTASGINLANTNPLDIDKNAASPGTSLLGTRSDHKHSIVTASAISVNTTNSEGTATSLARSDHTHNVTNFSITGQTQGDTLYFNGTSWVKLAAGQDGYYLQTHATGPIWASANSATNNNWYVASWFINSSTGSDSNNGLTSGTALKTIEELCNRLCPNGEVAFLKQATNVTITSGTYGNPYFNIGSNSLTINGTITSTANITTNVVTNVSAVGNIRGEIETASGTFVDQRRVRAVTGSQSGAIAFSTGLNGSASKTFVSSFISTTGTQVNITVGDAVVVDTLGVIFGPSSLLTTIGSSIVIKGAIFSNSVYSSNNVIFIESHFSTGTILLGGGTLQNCSLNTVSLGNGNYSGFGNQFLGICNSYYAQINFTASNLFDDCNTFIGVDTNFNFVDIELIRRTQTVGLIFPVGSKVVSTGYLWSGTGAYANCAVQMDPGSYFSFGILPTVSGTNNIKLAGVAFSWSQLPQKVGSTSAEFNTLFTSAANDVSYWTGNYWARLPAGTDGYVLTTHNTGSPPTWTPADATNLNIPGQTQGDILYFDGVKWNKLAAGQDGYVLTTHNTGNNPSWLPSGSNLIENSATGGSAVTLDLSGSNTTDWVVNLNSANCVVTFNPLPAFNQQIKIRFVQDGYGGRGVTLPSMLWRDNVIGMIDGRANAETILWVLYNKYNGELQDAHLSPAVSSTATTPSVYLGPIVSTFTDVISSTNIVQPNATAGLYSAKSYLTITNAGTAGKLVVNTIYTDESGTTLTVPLTGPIDITNIGNAGGGEVLFSTNGSSGIQYNVSSAPGTFTKGALNYLLKFIVKAENNTILPPLREVGTRSTFPNSTNSQPGVPLDFRSFFDNHLGSPITALQVSHANFAVVNGVETPSGGTMTQTLSVEYPIGSTRQTFLYNGSRTGVAANGAELTTDILTLITPIPDISRAKFWRFVTFGANVVYTAGPFKSIAAGDAGNFNNATDLTLTGTMTDDGVAFGLFPTRIMGYTNSKKDILLVTDSRGQGLGESQATQDSSGDCGDTPRAIGATRPYFRAGGSGASLTGWLAGNTKQMAAINLAPPSSIILSMGINDFKLAGRTSTQFLADCQTFLTLFPNIPVYIATISPWTTSTDSWATAANQTVGNAGVETSRLATNAAIRAGLPGYAGFVDVASFLEDASNPGKWKTNGLTGTSAYTADGLHATAFGDSQVSFSIPVPL